MIEEFLKLSKIDVSNATKQFSDMIVDKDEDGNFMTYFLNGRWGSGKSTFLKDTEQNSEGKLRKEDWHFRYLNLWEIQDDRTVFELAFSTIFPCYSKIYKSFSIFCIVVSLLLTPIFNLGLSDFLNTLGVVGIGLKIIFTTLGLVVSAFQMLKLKSDSIYISLFNRILGKKNKKVVLVVDDFDRVPLERQKDTYRLFNVIHYKIPVIFVGDFNKLTSNNDISVKFLTKIIDRRVELPVAISSKNVLIKYIQSLLQLTTQIDNSFDGKLSKFLSDDFLQNNLTLREINQFNNLFKSELNKKLGRVRASQLVVIVYLYLFHVQKYNELVSAYDNDAREIRVLGLFNDKVYRNIEEVLSLDGKSNRLPLPFKLGAESYFVSDNIINLSIKEADEILVRLFDNIELIKELNENREEFMLYLSTTKIEFRNLIKLLQQILLKVEDMNYEDLASIVVTKIDLDLVYEELVEEFRDSGGFWLYITKELDISKKCYFYIKYQVYSDLIFQAIKKEVIQYINNSKEIKNAPEVAYCLLQGKPLNYVQYKSELKKIFAPSQSPENREKITEFVSYFNIDRKKENNKNQYKFKNENVNSFMEFVNKELLKSNIPIYLNFH